MPRFSCLCTELLKNLSFKLSHLYALRINCAYTLYEMLAERNPEKAYEVLMELRECDRKPDIDCYITLISKLEKLLNVHVNHKYGF